MKISTLAKILFLTFVVFLVFGWIVGLNDSRNPREEFLQVQEEMEREAYEEVNCENFTGCDSDKPL